MTDEMQQDGATTEPAKTRGWGIVSFEAVTNPSERMASLFVSAGIAFAMILTCLALITVGWLFCVMTGITQLESASETKLDAAKSLLAVFGAAITAPLLAWRLWLSYMQAEAALKQAESGLVQAENAASQARSAETKLDIDRETQNAALYLKAVEMLGAMKEEKTTIEKDGKTETKAVSKPDLETRTGAIFALERLARDSVRDQPAILNMLCAYVRRNSGLDDYDKPMIRHATAGWPKARQDIQSAITVIGQRKDKWRNNAAEAGVVKLETARLMRVDMTRLDFSDTLFGFVNLQHALLWWAIWPAAGFSDTMLS